MIPAPWPYKLSWFAVFAVAYVVFYSYPNFYPRVTPHLLAQTAWEVQIPFLPWTFLVYCSDYVLAALVIARLNTPSSFHALVRRAFGALVLSGVVFWVYPTAMERPAFMASGSSFIDAVVRFTQAVDAPTNCFPSLHIGFTGLAIACLYPLSRPLFWGFLGWGLAITVSVLTTKQHYFWDIPGGLGLVFLVLALERFALSFAWLRSRIYKWDRTPAWDQNLPLVSKKAA